MSKKKSPVQFHFLATCTLAARGILKRFITQALKKQGMAAESIGIIFCDDKYLLGLNRQFLKHDYYTDILSFPLSSPGKPLIAEIYISIERVRENALNANISFKEELHRVIFHGILHFCGYKDNSAVEIRKIRAMEDKWLKAYFQESGQGRGT